MTELREGKIIGPKGPTGSDYLAYLTREKKDGMYKMTDRSLYGARAPFVKVYKKEEKLDGMSEDELARRLGMTLLSNTTECSCDRFETEEECLASGLGCQWRTLVRCNLCMLFLSSSRSPFFSQGPLLIFAFTSCLFSLSHVILQR